MDSRNPADAVPIGPGSSQPASPHPRRPPAHKSVSLRHTPPLEWSNVQLSRVPAGQPSPPSPTVPRSDRANPPSSISPALYNHKPSSGESSDAGKWFERSNNNVTHDLSVADNEPPFFLHNSSSSETPPEMLEQQANALNMHSASMPYRPSGAQLPAESSGSDDYRSVIDDLTIVNKKLRQKLRKYEKLYDAHLQNDKLFEVRFHGLPDDKKKELEETLRQFAMGLSDSPSNNSVPSVFPPTALKNATSSLTSTRFAESGYASMSASGQNSVSVPSSNTLANFKKPVKSPLNQQHHNVQSYLHDIPAGLIGKPLHLTEKAKKKLVVRRLEQIFAGKLSAPGDHPHPVQQQEVAQSAARADRAARELSGQLSGKEGIREARIMPQDDDMRASEDTSPDVARQPSSSKELAEPNSSSSGSPDQRPTRPLDLDPYRAQVPSENMDYIRHLGFTPPDMVSGDAPQDGHGWIYLNLLINMAQLHTISVTSDFVKNAVADYSNKFELSHDGRKIRWRGGHDVTRNSSDSSSEQLSSASPDDSDEMQRRERKQAKTGRTHSGASMDPAHHARKLARQEKEREKNKLAYTPLFFHQPSSEGDDEYNYDVDSSEYSAMPANATGNSSGLNFSGASPSRKRRDTGPIIFYNNARFCTDLSGDWRGATRTNPTSYESITSRPLGTHTTKKWSAERDAELHDSKGPLADPSQLEEQMDIDHSTSGESGIKFESERSEADDDAMASPNRINFEASGLGGVQSVDNFAIDVQLSKKRVNHPHDLVTVRRSVSKSKPYPHKILEVLKRDATSSSKDPRNAAQSIIASEIISASHQELPNSALPPPSMLPFDSSSGDADSDAESDVSSAASGMSSHMSVEPRRYTVPQLLNISPLHDGSEQSWDPEDDDESDSVDLLATARAIDPTAIHASEREYDSNMAERLAEDIPAGSSAATGAGGSGYNSPESRAAADAAENAAQAAAGGSGDHLLSKNLKRARTSDNFAMLNPGKAAKFD
ncbi:uncharacterized protein BDZ99DRAFT_391267 [Mytilinidion resinicola]|uniref:Frequency clock protein n=1 Tax=Mytilinidion resinicola TaxID=574789 RepID=A0A6A6YFX9_9PEZI|nr:uncharacterized protein BDZ99DRAFT_391267 [Mytilinidion resinicola]KAF2807726.1 hypothetical protein BDZ99DRAFT_391267 [Mytilinidion resinicola]